MKKTGLVFIILCMAVCFVPLLGMIVRPTTETTENRTLSEFPAIRTEEGKLNREFFSRFETWFQEHFAFRNELVYADARIQGDLFGVSAEEWVIYGKDGWLYYTSSLRDYQGTDRLTAREWYALRHNLSMAAAFAQERGARFVLAVPPNKNTLYGEQMPYYDAPVAHALHDMDRLAEAAEQEGIPYTDLAEPFRQEKEILYLKRDSHWNNKGALLVYDRLMDALGCAYDRYETVTPTQEEIEDGDLNRMLYSFYGEKETNYVYDIPQVYQMTNGAQSVEDPIIETACATAEGTLLMFRDSFGNTLVPLIANQFGRAMFTRETQYRLEKLMDAYAPEYVIMEKVERNLRDFIQKPPVFSAPEVQLPSAAPGDAGTAAPALNADTASAVSEDEDAANTVRMETARIDYAYYMLSGAVDRTLLQPETDIVISVNGTSYASCLTGENTFALYLKKEQIPSLPVQIEVMTLDGDRAAVVLTASMTPEDE